MKLSKKIISIIALSSVITFSSVQANDTFSHENKIERMAKRLDLTSEQQTNISAIMASFNVQNTKPDQEARKAKAQEIKAQFTAIMTNSAFDEPMVNELIEQRSAKKNSMLFNKIKLHHAIYQELTPEQQPKYLKMVERNMRKKMSRMKSHNKNKANN